MGFSFDSSNAVFFSEEEIKDFKYSLVEFNVLNVFQTIS